jgi:hypothetical protein
MEYRKRNGTVLTPFSSDDRPTAERLAGLFVLKVADDFIDGSTETSSLLKFVCYWDGLINAKAEEIRLKSVSGEWTIDFGGSKYSLGKGGKKSVAVMEALNRLKGVDQYFKATVRMFLDAGGGDSFKAYVDYLPRLVNARANNG